MSPDSNSQKEREDPIEIELEVIKTPKGLVPSVEGLHQVIERVYQEINGLKTENRSLQRLLVEQAFSLETIRSELQAVREALTRFNRGFQEDIQKITAHISALESTIEDQTINLELKIKTLENQLE